MALINLILDSRSNAKVSSKVVEPKSKYVNEVKPLGNIKPLQSPGLIADVKPNTLVVDYSSREYYLQIRSMLTKYPNYEFVAKVKSGALNRIKYWFKDKVRNVIVIYSFKEMEEEIGRAIVGDINLKEQGFDAPKEERFIPSYCILDNVPISYKNLMCIKYRLYKLRKYNDLDPFSTGLLPDKVKSNFNYREDKTVHEEEVVQAQDIPKIYGSNGTNLKVINGFITL